MPLYFDFKRPSGSMGGPHPRLTPLEQLRLMAMTSAGSLGSAVGPFVRPFQSMQTADDAQMMQDRLRYLASPTPLQSMARVHPQMSQEAMDAASKVNMKKKPAKDKEELR